MQSEIRKRLLAEAAALEKNSEFCEASRKSIIRDLMLMIQFESGHIHRVYPESGIAELMLHNALNQDFGFDQSAKKEVTIPRRIIFHNRQAIGDILMFTCAIRDFKKKFPDTEVQVKSTASHIWDHNPYINRESWIEIIDPLMLKKSEGKPSSTDMIKFNQEAIRIAIEEDKPVLIYIGPGVLTNASNRRDLHFANGYRISMEIMLGVSIPQGPIRPDIYMTEEEYLSPPIIELPYWLITAGEKGDWTCKTFRFSKWQKVIESLPNIKFVQLGGAGHRHPELKGDNVINFIGKTQNQHTGIRDLFNLFNYCEGSIGLVSFQMHLAAAFNKPCVTIAGAREPVHFTRYPGQSGYLASDGCLPCTVTNNDTPTACWYCKIERCPYKSEKSEQVVPLCADLFSVHDVVAAINRYYKGGRLNLNVPAGRSKLVNVVKSQSMKSKESIEVKKNTSVISEKEKPCIAIKSMGKTREELKELLDTAEGKKKILDILSRMIEENSSSFKSVPLKKEKAETSIRNENLWGFSFGGSSITEKDWSFISAVIKENNVKTVLEFGAGLSTLLLNDMGLKVVTLENKQAWIDKVMEKMNCNIISWDGQKVPNGLPKPDLIFVDGPAGGRFREPSVEYASKHSDLVIIHDAAREWDWKWQEKHLDSEFRLAAKGGHRCHFWRRGKLKTRLYEENAPLIKVVFNGRGDGGAERSIYWIMKEFIKRKWNVQYITPNPVPCGTFRAAPIEGVEVITKNLNVIKEECDILFLYTNDWIWDFPVLGDKFSNLLAKRKVMAVNYKAGKIAKVDWCQGWDHYLFLNSTLKKQTCQKGIVLAPPTDMSAYLKTEINYKGHLRIVRHSSQGDAKYPKEFNDYLAAILNEIPNSEIFLMPAPSFLSEKYRNNYRVHIHLRNRPPVVDFLKQGNCFWYKLPDGGYSEGGPKVIMEAQASGLPVVADNHSGAVDRLSYTSGTSGFLCNSFAEHLAALKKLAEDEELRAVLGKNSRQHAKKNYYPSYWIEQIIDGHPLIIDGVSDEEFICTPVRETDI